MSVEIGQIYRVKEVEDPFAEVYYIRIEDVKIDKTGNLWVQYAFARQNDDGTLVVRDGSMKSTMREKQLLDIYDLYSPVTKPAKPKTAIDQLEV